MNGLKEASMRRLIIATVMLALVATTAPVFALNTGTDILVPAAGRGTPWVTDLYVANPGDETVTGMIYWLVRGQSNPSPASISFTIAAGATAIYEDIILDEFGLSSAGGAFRVTASGTVHEMFTRLDLPLAHGADAAAIIEATVAGHDEAYHLTSLDFAGGRLTITRRDLPEGSAARLRIAARDVSLTLEPQAGTSILNILPATVDELIPDDEAQVTVRLLAGAVPLLSRVTRKSAAILDLQPGKRVYAQAKSIALLA